MPEVRKIEPTITVLKPRKRVAAYARISMESDRLNRSLSAQISYFSELIQRNPEWIYVGVYADSGISGGDIRRRAEFQRLIDDCNAGRIDIVLCKSISRFARSTVDLLETVRHLKGIGVEVRFEKENLKTFDPKVEMLLTILASLSQEESRSISENVNWGIRKKMTDGKFSLGYSHFLGYDKGVDGSLVINEEEAKVIRRIYALYIKGMSPYGIAKVLTEEGIKTPGGKTRWSDSTVKSILRNEKYCGRALLQKTFTPDFLTKKTVKNTGQVPSYYVEHSHAPIIDPDVYDMVQRMMEGRKRGRDRISSISIFSSKLRCGDCGSWYGSKTWHSTDKYKRVIWQCNHKFRGTKCSTPHFTENEIKELFVRAVNLLLTEKEEIISTYEMMREKLFSTTALVEERRALENELNVTARLVEDCIKENARIAQDQTAYEERYQSLVERYESAKKRYGEIVEQISDRTVRGEQVSIFLEKLREQDLIDTFDDDLWLSMVDFITVHDKSKVTVTFKDGSEIKLDR